MCGIFAVINKNNVPLNISRCEKALKSLMHRGPDWQVSRIINKNIFLGQVVLSMTGENKKNESQHFSPSKNFFILFNGEIYNYKELNEILKLSGSHSDADTKLLVSMFDKYEINKVNHMLDGMYAYIVYDKRKNSLIIGRDPVGEKILYFFEDNKEIIISSEINSIIDYVKRAEINLDILKTYFYTRHFLQLDKTIFKKIKIIEPGTLSVLNLDNQKLNKIGQISLNDYIDEKIYENNDKKKIEDVVEELDYLLNKNIQQMIPSNREFASIVSGGIDSGIISYYVCKYSNPKMLIFLNHIGKDWHTNKISEFTKILKKKINIYDVNDKIYFKNYVKTLSICNSPIHSHSFVGQLIVAEKISKKKCRGLFSGEGGDELFGGYPTYLQKITSLNKNISDYTKINDPKIFNSTTALYTFKNQLHNKWKDTIQSYSFVKNKSDRSKLSMMLLDASIQMSSNGLRGSDLMSMFYSVEGRTLLYRKEILKFALNLPIKFKINTKDKNKHMVTKHILKKLFLKHFPKELVLTKQGFSGFPNESIYLVDNKFTNIIKYLDITEFINDRSVEWKLINSELFLQTYKNLIITNY